jgi:hypothetical protein
MRGTKRMKRVRQVVSAGLRRSPALSPSLAATWGYTWGTVAVSCF